jgi:hypothetical protein
MTGNRAHQLLTQLLDAVDRNLALAETLKEPARIVSGERNGEADEAAGLAAAEKHLQEIHVEAVRLLRVVDAPGRWPTEEQLRDASVRMKAGEKLSADELRQALLD